MTKVEVRYELARPLEGSLREQVMAAHSTYGILRVEPTASLDGLLVEYDASRLTEADVDAVLRRAGVPVMRRA